MARRVTQGPNVRPRLGLPLPRTNALLAPHPRCHLHSVPGAVVAVVVDGEARGAARLGALASGRKPPWGLVVAVVRKAADGLCAYLQLLHLLPSRVGCALKCKGPRGPRGSTRSDRSDELGANGRSEDTGLIATCHTDYPPPKGRYPLPPHRGLDTFNFGRMLSGQIEDYGTKQRSGRSLHSKWRLCYDERAEGS